MISIGAMDHCLSPYDYIKNTSKMPSDTHSWTGLIAGTDSGVKWHDERMSAGYVVGADPVPVEVLAVRVAGPLSSVSTLRAETAGLLQCLSEKQ